MRISIVRDGNNILTIKEYTDISDTGEICHFLAELELIKLDLLNLFEEFEEDG